MAQGRHFFVEALWKRPGIVLKQSWTQKTTQIRRTDFEYHLGKKVLVSHMCKEGRGRHVVSGPSRPLYNALSGTDPSCPRSAPNFPTLPIPSLVEKDRQGSDLTLTSAQGLRALSTDRYPMFYPEIKPKHDNHFFGGVRACP